MPGLIRGVARTAVVAGTATAVSNRVSRRQASRWNEREQQQYQQQQYEQQQYQQRQYEYERAEQQPYVPPPVQPAPDPMAGRLEQLRQLGELRAQGVLTEAEFEREKALLLRS